MKITNLVKVANDLVTSEHYADYCQQYLVPLERAIAQSGYDGISEVTVENLKTFIVFANTFWMYLPDNPGIRQTAFFTLCMFCETYLPDCEDYEEYYG
ncbi:hypothetical protein KKP3664_000012 [Citrobacter phage KKP_3664]|nr:hypothetical protein KKP3664_000012 [Citrobacter phage KKP_3664]